MKGQGLDILGVWVYAQTDVESQNRPRKDCAPPRIYLAGSS